jgi:hypothetical protein
VDRARAAGEFALMYPAFYATLSIVLDLQRHARVRDFP